MATTRKRRRGIALIAAALLAAFASPPATAQAETETERTVLSAGHVDAMQAYYENGELGLRVKDDTGSSPVHRDPDDVLFQVLPEAETEIPEGDTWSFLGEAGDPMWMLPLSQDPDLLWPGWSTEPLPKGRFDGDTVSMSLSEVTGPGDVVLWTVNSFGEPDVTFSSRDGLPDTTSVNVPAHVHSYWAFGAEGDYSLTWEVTGTLGDGTEVTSGKVAYHWHVGDDPGQPDPEPDPDLDDRLVLDEGHVDVMSVHQDEGELTMALKDGTGLHDGEDVYRDPSDIALHARPESKTVLGEEALEDGYDRVGEPGDTVWHLPDHDEQGLLFAGWSTETIPRGALLDDDLDLALADFSGPGDLVMLRVGDFGDATALIDTAESLPQSIATHAKTHAHVNWYFTEPGVYRLTWRAEAALPDGTAVTSAPAEYVFVVDERPDGPGPDPDPDDPPAPEHTQTVTTAVDANQGGLVLSIDPNDRNVDLPAMSLDNTATRWTTDGDLRPVTVTDTRTDDPGWNATGQAGAFTSADDELSAGHLGWTPAVAAHGDEQSVAPGPPVDGLLDGGSGLEQAQTLATAPAGAGNGTCVLEAALRLDAPTDLESGTYTGLITFTAI